MSVSESSSLADEKVSRPCPPCGLGLLLTLELVTGVLKGYDQLLNLVLDEVQENLQGGECLKT